jgi:predicted ribosome quality control (RQC) complex YloA/Tae2 family protein
LVSLQNQLEAYSSSEQLDQIKTELTSLGYIKKTRQKPAQTKEKAHHFQFLTSDGFKVLVGRNDKENDYISFKLAKKDDLWFHVDGMPGSHVLLIREERNRDFGRDAISQAASLAAYFSKARNSKKVSVVYTLVKYIRKPKNAKPGLVTLGREKSIVVAPKLVK